MNCFKLKMTITQSLLLNYSSLLILSLIHFFQACHANCTPSACGLISNISSPFRLKGDPNNCGDRRFQLECENNVASIHINSIKYYVKAINHTSIRLVDASININNTCSFPIYSAYDFNFTVNNPYLILRSSTSPYDYLRTPINLMRCPHPLKNSSLFTEVTECAFNPGLGYTYIKVGHLNASEVTETCRVDVIVMTSWEFKDLKNDSLSEIHHSLLYGFELTVYPSSTADSFDKFLSFFYYRLIPILVAIAACHANCTPSACGLISNISSPFRLKGDPKKCGNSWFELECENNVASIDINSIKYYVKAINYSNNGQFDTSTIRLVDASININNTCSFPIYSAYHSTFSSNNPFHNPYRTPRSSTSPYDNIPTPINLMRCPHPLKNSSFFTEITADCASKSNVEYTYIKVGHLNASEVTETCAVDLVVMTSWIFKDLKNVSLSEIHHSLLYGFELTVCPSCAYSFTIFLIFFLYRLVPILATIAGLLCAVVSPPLFTILGFAAISLFLFMIDVTKIPYPVYILSMMICVPRIIIFPLAVWFFIYKFRRRRLSTFEGIESFLQSDNKLTPIRYSYSEIKKMTRGFHDKLGEGGYGSVYKGKLRSGHHVAVKLLGKSGSNGQDFMNEISTIGRIHHVNVVQLVGYCAQGSKRALVYDFMPNGSLEKYLFNREKMSFLNWETKFEIAVGVARGIEYLHRGCDVQILHFDIKPHNILLDDNFIPKVSDFGLAKLCSTDKKAVTMTAARGTIGYVAPELISRSIGSVSYKADVYSFGMLLMEMVGLNRELKGKNDESSKYFPCWIYDRFKQGVEIEIERAEEEINGNDENESSRNILVRKMTIVALWCIQMNPDDRPSMNEVLQMLEGDVERLQIPEYPSQSTQIQGSVDESGITCWSDSVSLLRHDDASISEITVQE